MDIPHFVYLSSIDRNVDCFYLLVIVTTTAIDIKYLLEYLFSVILGKYLRISFHMVILCFTFWGIGKLRICFSPCVWTLFVCCCCCCCLVTESCLTLLQLRGLKPARLLCPLDFPGKNTGLDCHFLLQGLFLTQGSNPLLLNWQADIYHRASREACLLVCWLAIVSLFDMIARKFRLKFMSQT